MGGQWPRCDSDCVRQLIDEWCLLGSTNISVVNLSATPIGQPLAFAGVHVSLMFLYQHFICARGLVFSRAYTYSELALGEGSQGNAMAGR